MKKMVLRIIAIVVLIGAGLWVNELYKRMSSTREYLRQDPEYQAAKESYKKNPNKSWYLDFMYK